MFEKRYPEAKTQPLAEGGDDVFFIFSPPNERPVYNVQSAHVVLIVGRGYNFRDAYAAKKQGCVDDVLQLYSDGAKDQLESILIV